MKKFVLKRVLISIVLLFFVTMIIYGIMRCMPTSFVENKARELAQKPGSKTYQEWNHGHRFDWYLFTEFLLCDHLKMGILHQAWMG